MPYPLSFFFSSRRRHTRWTGDWSSDVCSSDLRDDVPLDEPLLGGHAPFGVEPGEVAELGLVGGDLLGELPHVDPLQRLRLQVPPVAAEDHLQYGLLEDVGHDR